MRYAIAPSSIGWVGIVITPQGICALELADDAESLRERLMVRFAQTALLLVDVASDPLFTAAMAYLADPTATLTLPLDLQGTPFQRQVWAELQAIPYGQTMSYSTLAAKLGRPGAARPVAGACAANPVAVVIPCHRVIRGNGRLGGYRWGLARKRMLLEREG
ncbi:hypothetical protein CJ255_05975 [Candidatus Viridilinea mediisalina]|uniref:methylated-DNA--[protein]-cysteine S-methyltransferase n=1 Tax=Candidatus Viridilinea mediisalina TaxID=2024553 RepID=A0A2A6RMD1_9CHLR|nr:hypothetical protein CJ255_05975 [Candidatus Viridilinea mediisalina]